MRPKHVTHYDTLGIVCQSVEPQGDSNTMDLLRRLWRDHGGGLVAAEYLLLGTLLTIGLLVGIAAVQEALLDRLANLADLICKDCGTS